MSNVQNQTELERQPGIQRNTMSVAVAGNTVNEAGADTTNQAINPPLEERVSYQITLSFIYEEL